MQRTVSSTVVAVVGDAPDAISRLGAPNNVRAVAWTPTTRRSSAPWRAWR